MDAHELSLEDWIVRCQTEGEKRLMDHLLVLKRERVFAKPYFDKIHAITLKKLEETYTFPKGDRNFDLSVFRGRYDVLQNRYPDMMNWAWLCYSVCLYHSLGDTLGYYNGIWEFNNGAQKQVDAEYIYEMIDRYVGMGCINTMTITNWKASDDTVMYLATVKAMMTGSNVEERTKKAKELYLAAEPIIKDRHPGVTTMTSLEVQRTIAWNNLRYDSASIGNGAVMRTGCIGLFDVGNASLKNLITHSVLNSQLTHNSATSILGCITTALFTSYAVKKVPIETWPSKLLKIIKSTVIEDIIETYRKATLAQFRIDRGVYIAQWEKYTSQLMTGTALRTDLRAMNRLTMRYSYLVVNFSKGCGVPGGCADDAVIMAFDALIRCNGSIESLLFYAVFHPGDSDTVGALAFSWFAGFYGSPDNERIVSRMIKNLEFYEQFQRIFDQLLRTAIRTYYIDLYTDISRRVTKQLIN